MTKYYLVLAISYLTACICPAYTTRQGIKVYNMAADKLPERGAVNKIIDYANQKYQRPDLVETASIYFFNDWIFFSNEDGTVAAIDGYTDPLTHTVAISIIRDCVADSSLFHELGHIVHDTNGVPDFGHSDKQFWKRVKRLEDELILLLCPPGYIHQDVKPDLSKYSTQRKE